MDQSRPEASLNHSPCRSKRLVNIGFALTGIYVLIALLLVVGRVVGLTDMKGDTFITLSMTGGTILLLYMIGAIVVDEYLYERNRPKVVGGNSPLERLMLPAMKLARFVRHGGLGKMAKLVKGHFPSLYVGARAGLIIFLGTTVGEMLGGEMPIRPWSIGMLFGVTVAAGHYMGRLYERTGRL